MAWATPAATVYAQVDAQNAAAPQDASAPPSSLVSKAKSFVESTAATAGGAVSMFVNGVSGDGNSMRGPDCDVTLIEDEACCQMPTGSFIVVSDRFGGAPYPRLADAFPAVGSGTIDEIIWWPCFYNPTLSQECFEDPPPDNYWVRFYEDAGGFPDESNELGPAGGQALEVDTSASLGGGSRCYKNQSMALTTPISISDGECYWIEITGVGDAKGCQVFLTTAAANDPAAGNADNYVAIDDNGVYGPDDIDCSGLDMAVCLNTGMTQPGCTPAVAACCTPGAGVCDCNNMNVDACCAAGGTFYPGEDCTAGFDCPSPANNDCADAIDVTDAGQPCSGGSCVIEFETVCSTTDGGNDGASCTADLGADIWYEYHTAAAAVTDLTISGCNVNGYDGGMTVYSDGTPNCSCPGSLGTIVACDDDGCGVGGGMPTVNFPVQSNTCYLIRVGGWSSEWGAGELEFTLNGSLGGPVLYVNHLANGADNGTSWTDAYRSLQDALADPGVASGAVTSIWVARGTYYPDDGGGETLGDRAATFQLVDGLGIYGGFDGGESDVSERDVEANETILSGELATSDCCRAKGSAGCDNTTCETDVCALPTAGKCCTTEWTYGCAVFAQSTCSTICADNSDNSYHVVTGNGTDATAVLDGFTITAGNADGAGNDANGGGMHITAGSPTVDDCVFSLNAATTGGGGIYLTAGSPTITNCQFVGNSSLSGGGGILSTGTPTISSCLFLGNSASAGGGMNQGGTPLVLSNSLFSGNTATPGVGGGLVVSGAVSSVDNCTFGLNSAPSGEGGGAYLNLANHEVANSVFWGNSDVGGTDESAQIHVGSDAPTVNYSIVQGTWTGAGGTGNSASDPLFVDADGPDNTPGTIDDDLRLLVGSPAIDAGENASVPLDAADLDGDGDTGEQLPLDLDQGPRFIDDLPTSDTGSGTPPIVDMGAYEFFRDCNGNSIPDSVDIANDPSLDVDLDGVIDGCVFYDAGCGADIKYSCSLNWDGDTVPINAGADTFAVTIAAGEVDLDLDVTIDSMVLTAGASLNVTCEAGDADCVDAASDLTIVGEAGLLIEGDLVNMEPSTLFVDHDRVVTVLVDGVGPGGPVVIGPGGEYRAAPGAARGGITPTLSAGTMEVHGGPMSGSVSLVSGMSVNLIGSVQLNGSITDLSLPILSVAESSNVTVGGDLITTGAVDLTVNSAQPVVVGGNLDNQCVDPSTFSWEGGSLVMDGSSGSQQQRIEAAGVDFGASVDGAVDNYAVGNLTIAATANVLASDSFDNDTIGQGSCTEAIYVDTLTLESGAALTIDNCRIYYNTLVDNGVTPNLVGCGGLITLNDLEQPGAHDAGLGVCTIDDDCDGNSVCSGGVCYLPKARYLSFVPGNAGASVAFSVALPDGRTGWVGEPAQVDWQGIDQEWVSLVVDAPVFRIWDDVSAVYVSGCAVIPDAVYEVRATSDGVSFTDPLSVVTTPAPQTGSWADIVGAFDAGTQTWTPPNGFVNFNDIDAAVKKFQASPTAAAVTVVDLHPQWPNYFVNFSDIDMIIKGFQDTPYPVPVADCQTVANCPLGGEAPCLP